MLHETIKKVRKCHPYLYSQNIILTNTCSEEDSHIPTLQYKTAVFSQQAVYKTALGSAGCPRQILRHFPVPVSIMPSEQLTQDTMCCTQAEARQGNYYQHNYIVKCQTPSSHEVNVPPKCFYVTQSTGNETRA